MDNTLKLIVFWVMMQGALCGMISIDAVNQVHKGTFVCGFDAQEPVWAGFAIGAIVPMAIFAPDPTEVTKYCDNPANWAINK